MTHMLVTEICSFGSPKPFDRPTNRFRLACDWQNASVKFVMILFLSLSPSRRGAFAQNVKSNYYKTPILKPNTRKYLENILT